MDNNILISQRSHTRPIITAIILLVIVALIGGAGSYYAFKKSRSLTEQTLPSLSHLAQGYQYRGQAFLHLLLCINNENPNDSAKQVLDINYYSDNSYHELDLYEDWITEKENRILFDDLIRERESYLDCRTEIISLAKSGDRVQANYKLIHDLLPMYERYLNKGQQLVQYTTNDASECLHTIRLISILSQLFAIFSSVLIFILGFFLGYTR